MGKLLKLGLLVALGYGAYVLFLQPEWVSVGNAAEGFTVEFPKAPKRTTDKTSIPGAGVASTVYYAQQEGYNGFSVISISSRAYAKNAASQKQFEQSMVRILSKQFGARHIKTTQGTHQGEAYTEVEMRLDSSSATLHARGFLKSGRLMIFSAMAHTVGSPVSGRQRFFRSIDFPEQ